MDVREVVDSEKFGESLLQAAQKFSHETNRIGGLRRMSGGANQEIWAFTAQTEGSDSNDFILRRAPPGSPRSKFALTLTQEGEIAECAWRRGVPVPAIRYILCPEDGLGEGYIMDFVEGETLGSKIVRSHALAQARTRLAYQCGEALARIHALTPSDAPSLRTLSAQDNLDLAVNGFREMDRPRPVFEYAVRWLTENRPDPVQPALVHGDFRNGNIVVRPEGLVAVLDWEGASFGDPMQDLAWICVNSWRFGNIDLPVGGFGTTAQLYAGYEAAGGKVDIARANYWEVLGTLRWGVTCVQNERRFNNGDDSIERAMIARRASETEIDLLQLLAPRR